MRILVKKQEKILEPVEGKDNRTRLTGKVFNGIVAKIYKKLKRSCRFDSYVFIPLVLFDKLSIFCILGT
jgi:hypothetical protein